MPSTTTLPATTASVAKNGLLKRITTKLRSPPPPTPSTSTATPASPVDDSTVKPSISRPKRRGTLLPSIPRPRAPTPAITNSFISPEQREAALLARGLVPRRYRDARGDTIPMSQQEAALDQRYSVLVEESPSSGESDGESEAKRIREDWLRRNAQAASALGDKAPRASLCDVIDGDEGVVIGKPVSPRRPRIVQEHSPPPLSPSQAELRDGSSLYGDDVDSDSLEPADVPLPPSTPASPTSTRNGKASAVDRASRPDSPVLAATEFCEARQGAGTTETTADIETTHSTEAHVSNTGAENSSQPQPVSPTPITPSQAAKRVSLPSVPSTPSSPPPAFADPRSPRAPALLSLSAVPPPTTLHRGRSTGGDSSSSTMPALSPTRTTSSCTTSDAPHTPQPADDTASRARSASVTSGESASSAHAWVLRRPELGKSAARGRADGKAASTVAAVIVESPTEDDEDVLADLPTPKPAKGLFKRSQSQVRPAPSPRSSRRTDPAAARAAAEDEAARGRVDREPPPLRHGHDQQARAAPQVRACRRHGRRRRARHRLAARRHRAALCARRDAAPAPARAAQPDDAQPREHLAPGAGDRGRGEPAAERGGVPGLLNGWSCVWCLLMMMKFTTASRSFQFLWWCMVRLGGGSHADYCIQVVDTQSWVSVSIATLEKV